MTHLSPTNRILERLENVKQNGDSSQACCPSHESKSKSTLSVKEGDDGRVLLHCFAGCSALEIVHALGLELADLFERPVEKQRTPRQAWEQRELMKMRRWRAARTDFLIEVSVVLSAMEQQDQGYPLSEEDRVRMIRAGRLIRSALGEL